MAKNSIVYLAKGIKINKEQTEVMSYTENQMISLITSSNHLVYSANNYSFLRDTGTIQVQASYRTCSQANYMAFQNPDYENKWFFAFIDRIVYRGEATTEIEYSLDYWSTWYEYWNPKSCYVVREHVVSDTIGEHTVPEGLETGEYIINSSQSLEDDNRKLICMAVSKTGNFPNFNPDNRQYGGVYSGLIYLLFGTPTNCSKMIRGYDDVGGADAIYSIFMVPYSLVEDNASWYNVSFGNQTDITVGLLNTSTQAKTISTKNIDINTTLNGYTPKNNKLYSFPFNYLYMTNNAGGDAIYHYEDFINNSPQFITYGTISVGCSFKTVPINYKKFNDLYANYSNGLVGTKYAICSWNSDAFTNWLTQNSVNIANSMITSTATMVGSAYVGNASGVISGGQQMASTINSIYQASLTPNQAKGDTSGGDINMAVNAYTMTLNKMSIKYEYAKIIDDYFTLRGYKVNSVKVPNMSHRQNYNYVEISGESTVAFSNNHNNISVPAQDLKVVNDLFRRGITIWHNHSHLGDYSVSNNIT